jgi:hypothetical protein
MYKYKKTIIINNRNRRIFSKEKSNNEYILYKNNYITLNAYNKKTSGGSLTSAAYNPKNTFYRLVQGEKTEFKIPNSIKINNHDYDDNDVHRYKFINVYNEDISNAISNYLKKQSLIKDSNNLKWIITAFATESGNRNTTVTGYTDEKLNTFIQDLNSSDTLIQYGTDNNLKKMEVMEEFNNNTNNKAKIYTEKNKLYYYYLANEEGINNYKLLKQQYYIYYIITIRLFVSVRQPTFNSITYKDDNNVDKTYTINEGYNLFNNNCWFICDNIIEGNKFFQHSESEDKRTYHVIFSYFGPTPPSATPLQEITGGKRRYRKK